MRGIAGIIITMLAFIGISASPARALDATSPPVEYFSDVFITAYKLDPDSTRLDVIELYNDTAVPQSVDGWTVQGMVGEDVVCTVVLDTPGMYIPPDGYVAFADSDTLIHETVLQYVSPVCKVGEAAIDNIRLFSSQQEEVIGSIQVGTWVRKGITNTYRDTDDEFKDNFADINSRSQPVIYAGSWYQPLTSTELQITEIVPRARDCAPNNTELDCSDYVKVYNPSSTPIDLSQMRMRIGHRDQTATTGNTITTNSFLLPGAYAVLSKKTDGSAISITDSGGWIWFEDLYGLKRLDETTVRYESSSSTSKVGWAWAYDSDDGSWKWTSTTTPYNQPSRFTLPVAEESVDEQINTNLKPCASDQFRNPETNRCKKIDITTSSFAPCAIGQERNPETNRCRAIVSATSTLVPCAPGQSRNPATNRCRSTLSASSSLVPCDVGEERNPATNRCRQITSTSSLKPCEPGQERNPETNRCRKVSSAEVLAASNFPVEPIVDTGQAFAAWWALGGVLLLGAGYGTWEWRSEISRTIRNIMTRGRNIE